MNNPMVYNQHNFNILKGPELKIKLLLYLRDLYLGKSMEVMIQKQIACPHCKGTGADNPNDIAKCKECQGKGRVTRRVELGGGFYNLFTQTCQKCHGRGEVVGRTCHVCKSHKIMHGLEEFSIRIHPGTASNANIRYTNMGDERLEGAPSDVIFEIVEIADKVFKRENNDLKMNL
jgi:DnaJ-related protein SCJ1